MFLSSLAGTPSCIHMILRARFNMQAFIIMSESKQEGTVIFTASFIFPNVTCSTKGIFGCCSLPEMMPGSASLGENSALAQGNTQIQVWKQHHLHPGRRACFRTRRMQFTSLLARLYLASRSSPFGTPKQGQELQPMRGIREGQGGGGCPF